MFSNAFHPQIDGHIEVINHSLCNSLRCLVFEHVTNWDLTFPHVEFAFNNSMNMSIGRIPFEVVYGFSLYTPLDLNPLPLPSRISEAGLDFF